MEIASFRKELGQSFSPAECAIGVDDMIAAENDFVDVYTLCWMTEPTYRPVVENGFVAESVCVVASVDGTHTHAKVNGQFSRLDDSFLHLCVPRIYRIKGKKGISRIAMFRDSICQTFCDPNPLCPQVKDETLEDRTTVSHNS